MFYVRDRIKNEAPQVEAHGFLERNTERPLFIRTARGGAVHFAITQCPSVKCPEPAEGFWLRMYRFIKKSLRTVKEIYFFLIEVLGSSIFSLLRFLHFFPQIKEFSKDRAGKILVIRTDRIGDVICSLPTVRALRQHFPNSFIAYLATPYTQDLLWDNKDIDEVLVDDPRVKNRILSKRFKENPFDLAIILSPYFRSAWLGFLSGASFRIGYSLNGSGFLLTHKVDLKNRFKHEIETCLDVVRRIGVDTQEKRPQLFLQEEELHFAENFFNERGISDGDFVIGIHPGAHHEYQRWDKDKFAELADGLLAIDKVKVIFFRGPLEKAIISSFLKKMKQTPIVADISLTPRQLAALIQKCHIFVGNNSGPIHIAAAVRTPVVAIFGNIHPLDNETRWAPYGQEHIIVRKDMDCLDCHPGHCAHYQCLNLISTEDVLSAVRLQMERIKSKPR